RTLQEVLLRKRRCGGVLLRAVARDAAHVVRAPRAFEARVAPRRARAGPARVAIRGRGLLRGNTPLLGQLDLGARRRLSERRGGDGCRENGQGAPETDLIGLHSRPLLKPHALAWSWPALFTSNDGDLSPEGRACRIMTAVVADVGPYDIRDAFQRAFGRPCAERPMSLRYEFLRFGAGYGRAAWAATIDATHAVSRLPVAMCRNSFGPCAFDCGPSTPVTRNCASGKRSPSMFMNGIVPPVPMYTASRPKNVRDACCSACSSHGATGGAFHPAMLEPTSNVTFAPYGGSLSSADFALRAAASGSTPGGSRNDSFTLVYGRSTLPALPRSGSPSAPVTARHG